MSRKSSSTSIDRDIRRIEYRISDLHEKIIEKRPSHFNARDIVNSFFASLLIGLIFIFKGSLLSTAVILKEGHLAAIVLITLIILSLKIYYIGYSRVKDKKKRPFVQFWIKRMLNLYVIAVLVSIFMVYLFGINLIVQSNYEVLKVVITLSMPCAIGAAVPSLLKQY